jgi:hypothetical protein
MVCRQPRSIKDPELPVRQRIVTGVEGHELEIRWQRRVHFLRPEDGRRRDVETNDRMTLLREPGPDLAEPAADVEDRRTS